MAEVTLDARVLVPETVIARFTLAANSALSIAAISMSGVMGIGFTGDWNAFPDLRLLALDVEESFSELQKAAGI